MIQALEPHWTVIFHDDFDPEFDSFPEDARDALLEAAEAVRIAGPKTGRPHVDTLVGSKHGNMKELRYKAGNGTQVWRAAFAFDTEQQAVVLVAAEKQGSQGQRFYKALIKKADKRFDDHLKKLEEAKQEREKNEKRGKKAAAGKAGMVKGAKSSKTVVGKSKK
jgi:hypothetical protein